MRTTVLILVLWLTAFVAAAQQPAPMPTLDVLDKQAIDLALKAAATANTACQALDSYKFYEETRAFVNAQVKAKYPGYVLNWQTKRLEPQKAGQ